MREHVLLAAIAAADQGGRAAPGTLPASQSLMTVLVLMPCQAAVQLANRQRQQTGGRVHSLHQRAIYGSACALRWNPKHSTMGAQMAAVYCLECQAMGKA